MHDPYFNDATEGDSLDSAEENAGLDEDDAEEMGTGNLEDINEPGHEDGPEVITIEIDYVEVDDWGVPLAGAMNFAPASLDDDGIVGEPLEDMENWHQQSYPDTCAVVSQEFILNELTGQDFTEEQLREEAIANGLYSPGGTPPDAVGGLLELHGIDVERDYNASFDDLKTQLDAGNKVIVGVDADEIWYPEQDGDTPLTDAGTFPGGDVNHAVQVIGIDPDTQMVILNDPGSPDGRGLMIPADQFMNAWADGGNFMVHTTGSPIVMADANDAASDDYRLGSWEKWSSGYQYERDPDGNYTGNWST